MVAGAVSPGPLMPNRLRAMRLSGRTVIAAVVAGGTSLGGQSLLAVDDDVPKREPTLVWEAPVECDSGVELAASGTSGRHCTLAFSHDVAYVHEHAGAVGGTGPFRLSAIDIATGDLRWSQDVGATFEIRLTDEAVVLSDKAHIEVFDAETGTLRFTRQGGLLQYNRYGVLIVDDGPDAITALDAGNGDELWSASGQVGAMCRDFVAIVPGRSQPAAPFRLVDQRTGDERWSSEEPFDPLASHMTCSGAPWMYVTSGDRVMEIDSYDGWTTWETQVPGAGLIDLYREVALVRSGVDGETVVAIKREDGSIMWQASADAAGASLSWIGRLREDAAGLFTLNPLTGQTVQRVDPAGAYDVVGVSDTRVVVAEGSVITAYGMNDLGVAWQFDVGGTPDDSGVSNGYLVVRSGPVLRGYGATPRLQG